MTDLTTYKLKNNMLKVKRNNLGENICQNITKD